MADQTAEDFLDNYKPGEVAAVAAPKTAEDYLDAYQPAQPVAVAAAPASANQDSPSVLDAIGTGLKQEAQNFLPDWAEKATSSLSLGTYGVHNALAHMNDDIQSGHYLRAFGDNALAALGVFGGMGGALAAPVTGAAKAFITDPFVAHGDITPAQSEIASDIIPFTPGLAKGAASLAASGINALADLPSMQTLGENAAATMGADAARAVAKPATADAMENIARQHYAEFDKTGKNTLGVDPTASFLGRVQSLAPSDPVALAAIGETPLTSRINSLTSALSGDQQLTLSGAHALDKDLGNQINMLYRSGDNFNASQIGQIQDALRDAIGSGPLTPARQAFAQAMKARDVENAIYRSTLTTNPDTSLSASFRQILTNPSRVAGYTPDEVSAMEDATKPGFIAKTVKLASGALPLVGAGIGAMGGGEGGAVIGDLIGSGAKVATSKALGGIQRGKADKLLQIIGSTVPDAPANLSALPENVIPSVIDPRSLTPSEVSEAAEHMRRAANR